MLRIDTEKDLIRFLKVLSEEAVEKSRSSLDKEPFLSDEYQEDFTRKLQQDKKVFGKVSEQDEQEQQTQKEKPKKKTDAASDQDKEEKKDSDDKSSPDSKKDVDVEKYGASFDSVMAAINDLRSGKSFKDSTIRDQAMAYYDRLSDDERKVLLIFFKEFAKILTGAVKGSDAADPGDPPFSMSIHPEKGGDTQAASADQTTAAQTSQAQPKPSSKGVEDTSAPIRVSESQDLESIRAQVRLLMR